LRLGLKARATKDVDTLFRGTAQDFETAVDQALSEPWGPFVLERTNLERIAKAPRLIKPYRFAVKLGVRGKTWRRVQVEVSFPEGNIGALTVPVAAPAVGYFGVETPDQVVAIAMDYQVAQKMHAASDPDAPPDVVNERVRDIVDLVLISTYFYADGAAPASLKSACLDVFDARAAEAIKMGKAPRRWPPTFVSNASWERAYPRLAEEVGLVPTLEEAVALVQEWVAQIDKSEWSSGQELPPVQLRDGGEGLG
jgi:hypothetical protein